MTCDRYWRDGIVLVERGLDDPHGAGCADCTRAHASRHELIAALPRIGAGRTGDPRWQARVWRRIDGQRAPAIGRWLFAGALAMACAIALWIGLDRDRPDAARPRFEIVPGAVAMRSRSAQVDERLRIAVDETSDVWIYRAGRLVLQCRARHSSDGCVPDAGGMIVELALALPGAYHAIVVAHPVAAARGVLDDDRAALEAAGTSYVEHAFSVR